MPPFERDFSSKDDLIDHKHRPNQCVKLPSLYIVISNGTRSRTWTDRISGSMNWLMAFIIPMAVTVIIGLVRRSAIEVHHSLLALYSGR